MLLLLLHGGATLVVTALVTAASLRTTMLLHVATVLWGLGSCYGHQGKQCKREELARHGLDGVWLCGCVCGRVRVSLTVLVCARVVWD